MNKSRPIAVALQISRLFIIWQREKQTPVSVLKILDAFFIFQELGLESLKSRRWLRKLCLFYKTFHKKSPSYLFQLIPPNNNVYATRSSQSNKISSFKTRHNFFKDSFFPAVISEWNSLDINIQNSSSINVFKKELLRFIRPEHNSI